MRPVTGNVGSNIPAFLTKLWKMVNDPQTDHLICWSPGGQSFIIQNEAQFWYNLLPIYYKHNNMSSFIRQLNMYGFHKVSSDNGGMDCDKDEIKFFHPFFRKDQPTLMKHIKRKIATTKSSTTTGGEENKINSVDQITKVLVDVKQLRGRQESVDGQLAAMKQENAALWRELALLRQKHMKQQQIVNKLIHFLVTIVQPSRSGLSGLGVKRRYPLMIDDSKYSKLSKTEANSDGPTIHELETESALSDSLLLDEVAGNDSAKNIENQIRIESPPSVNSFSEPETVLLNIPIEETDLLPDNPLDNEMLMTEDPLDDNELTNSDCANVDCLLGGSQMSDTNNTEINMNDTELSQAIISDKDILRVAEEMYDNRIEDSEYEDTKSAELLNPNMKDVMISNMDNSQNIIKNIKKNQKLMTVATRSTPDSFKVNPANGFSDELDNHLEATQGELDTIKDMLYEGYSLDANALLGSFSNPFDAVPLQLFNPDEDFPLDLPNLTTSEESSKTQNSSCDPMMSGSELTTYVNPPFVLDFENLFEDSADADVGGDAGETTMEALPGMDGQINTPIVIKKEPIYPAAKGTTSQ